MTHASIVDLNADFVGFGGSNLNVLDREVLSSLPGNGGLCTRRSDVDRKLVEISDPHLAGNGLSKNFQLSALPFCFVSLLGAAHTFPTVSAGILYSYVQIRNMSIRRERNRRMNREVEGSKSVYDVPKVGFLL